jgi:hypothetical protein
MRMLYGIYDLSQQIGVSPWYWWADIPGPHILKFWMIDPGVVLERIVVDFGGTRPSYLGPPERVHSE